MTDSEQLTALLIVLGVAAYAISHVIAASRGPESATVQNSSRVSSVPTKIAPAEAFKAVVGFANAYGYSVVSIDEPTLRLCLLEAASWKSYGYFMPINVLAAPEGGAVVEIGTKARLNVPTLYNINEVARSHEKCASGIRAALFARS